jgi:RNA polymerase sigma factor (TIGR02999 family)
VHHVRPTLKSSVSGKMMPSNRKLAAYDVTLLLRAWSAGDTKAGDDLLPLLYRELRRRAAAYMRRERPGHVLQPTALVHEAYLRLVDSHNVEWQDRAHFFAVASQIMRHILVDHARAAKVAKRSGAWARVSLVEDLAKASPPNVDVLALDLALTRLAEFDSRKSRVAELRYFSGLSLAEVAHFLNISVATVEREWQAARAWLYLAMKGEP